MFCPTCGRELPEGSRFCPGCGKAVGNGASGSAPPAPRRSKRLLVFGAVAVAVVALASVAALFATGVLGRGGAKLSNGRYELYGFVPYTFVVSEGDGGQTIAFVYPYDVNDTVMFSGRLVEDGSNDLGPIWRVEDVTFPSGDAWNVESVRVQLPEGAAEGDPTGRWYLEITLQENGVMYVVTQIDKDGTVRSIISVAPPDAVEVGTSILDEAQSIDEVYSGVYQNYPYYYSTDYGFDTTYTLRNVPNADPSTHVYYVEDPNGDLAGIVSIALEE